jgi:FMN phosphatase YigB (HAD superfamily)
MINAQKSNIIFDLAHVLFRPISTSFEFEGPYFIPIDEGISILESCAAQRDAHGNRLHKLFVLSNLDSHSLEQLQLTFPDIFAYFRGIVISGMVNFEKPDPRIFIHLMQTYSLEPHHCIFIDDKKENIISAQFLGITGILCDEFSKVKQELSILNVI